MLYLFLQVRELQDEVDEFKDKCSEMEREKEGVALQLQQAKAKADSEALSRDEIQCCRQTFANPLSRVLLRIQVFYLS